MKIIHAADIHLGSKLGTKFPKEISQMRKMEVRDTFKRMVAYAAANSVQVILLAGDVFDSDTPYKKDKEFFYSVVRGNPDIDFLYLRGNHDCNTDYEGESFANLKTFSDSWTSYSYGDVVISAIEMTKENATSLYSTLSLDGHKKNIVMLHGQIADSMGVDKIHTGKLRDKNIDYLALGHVHKYSFGKLDERGTYAYCGCLEGRGFDETGDKGFILLEVDKEVKHTFVPFAQRKIVETQVDITGLSDAYAVAERIKEQVAFDNRNIFRVVLTGELTGDIEGLTADVTKYLSSECTFLDVKDSHRQKLDWNVYEGDLSLRGEFARVVGAMDLSDEDKTKVLAYGFKAMLGSDIEE
jgi:DNA repair exonuclease SbcCD nuclease subunit